MRKYCIALIMLTALVFSVSAQMIKTGNVLSWSTSAGQNGALKIVSTNGLVFEADQTNEKNTAAGVIRLYGAIVDGGKKMVLINIGQWKGVWEGNISATEISGKLTEGSSAYTFKITSSATTTSTAPFITGKTLKWETTAAGGQKGTIFVTSTKGTMFYLDQKNFNNTAAGITKLEGEVKDGKIYIYNRQWNETWIGVYGNGVVTGKINSSIPFNIME